MVFFDTAGVESVVMQTADGGLRRGSHGTKSCRGRKRSRPDAMQWNAVRYPARRCTYFIVKNRASIWSIFASTASLSFLT